MKINTNISAQNTLRNLGKTESAVADSTAKLSSGFRINKASDDAAGLAIANKLRNTGRALSQASRNADQASAMLQVADGGVQQISSILDRMKELATQASSANVGSDAGKLDAEYQQLKSEIGRVISTTVYQGVNLLDGTAGAAVDAVSTAGHSTALANGAQSAVASTSTAAGTYTLYSDKDAAGVVTVKKGGVVVDTALAADGAQTLNFSKIGLQVSTTTGFAIGDGTNAATFDGKDIVVTAGAGLNFVVDATGNPSSTSKDELSVALTGLSNSGLTHDLNSISSAQSAMGEIDTVLNSVNTAVGQIGAAESRLSYASQAVASKIQNYSAAESTIRDVDMAAEMSNFQKNNILQQAGVSMLAQANSSAQSVLKLFQ